MINIEQLEFQDILNLSSIDLLLTAVGYESRASHLSTLLNSKKINQKHCLQLVVDCNLKEKSKFAELGFKFSGANELNKILEGERNSKNIVIDYSVMNKSIYAEIIRLISKSDNFQNTNLYFSYTQSIYETIDKGDTQISTIKRILTTDDKLMTVPKNGYKLIISLGHERLSAIGIIENLEISYDDVYVLINKENSEAPYYKECMLSNKDFLSLLKPHQIIEINFFNFSQTISVLDSIYYKLSLDETQIILAPMSVKSFSLLSMIHSLRYPNVFFYNVTSIITRSAGKKKADTSIPPLIYLVNKQKNHVKMF
jgi:hypothetical protein